MFPSTRPAAKGPAEGAAAGWLARLNRVLDALAWLCMLVAGVMLVALIAIFGWLVFGRYVLNDTPTWVEQVSLLLVVYIAFLGGAVGIREGTHLSIDFVREALPPRIHHALCLLADAALVVFAGFMTWQGWGLVLANTRRAIPMIHMSESWRALPLVICGVLVLLFAGTSLVTRLTASRASGD